MKRIEEGSSQLVMARCDGAVDLEVADHALDAVAVEVDVAVPSDRCFAIGPRRTDRLGRVGLEGGSQDQAASAMNRGRWVRTYLEALRTA